MPFCSQPRRISCISRTRLDRHAVTLIIGTTHTTHTTHINHTSITHQSHHTTPHPTPPHPTTQVLRYCILCNFGAWVLFRHGCSSQLLPCRVARYLCAVSECLPRCLLAWRARVMQSTLVRTRLLLIFGWVTSPFGCRQLGGKFDSEEFMVGLWFLRLSCALLVATVLPCAVVLCLCTQLPVGTGDVVLDKIELSPSFRVQASGSWRCVVRFHAIRIALVCVGPVGMATSLFQGLFFLVKALVGRFMVLVPLAALPVALLVAIVGLTQEFPCAGFAHCFQFFSDALLAAACAAFVGIIMFFTSVCAAAWPLALENLKMIGYVSFAAAGIAASLVLYRVFVCVSTAAARP